MERVSRPTCEPISRRLTRELNNVQQHTSPSVTGRVEKVTGSPKVLRNGKAMGAAQRQAIALRNTKHLGTACPLVEKVAGGPKGSKGQKPRESHCGAPWAACPLYVAGGSKGAACPLRYLRRPVHQSAPTNVVSKSKVSSVHLSQYDRLFDGTANRGKLDRMVGKKPESNQPKQPNQPKLAYFKPL